MIDVESLAIRAALVGAKVYLNIDLKNASVVVRVKRGEFTEESKVAGFGDDGDDPGGGWKAVRNAYYDAIFKLDGYEVDRIKSGGTKSEPTGD